MSRLAWRLSAWIVALVGGLSFLSVAGALSSPDVTVSITAAPSPVFGGAAVTYTVTVSNAPGSPDATGVLLTSYLAPGETFVSATPASSCVPAAGYVVCSLGTVTAAGPVATEIVVTTPAPAVDWALASFAYVSGTNEPTANQGNNTASNVTTVLGEPDVTLTKAAAPDPVITGNNLTYTLTPHNIGTGTAAGVTIIDPLPAGTTFVSASAGCTNSAGTVICTIGTIAPASDGPAKTIVVQTPSVLTTTVVTNTATVSAANELLPAQGNNAATAATTIPAPPDVTLSKAASIDPVTAGDPLTYTLTAHNLGAGDASGVTITDPLPPGTAFVAASAGCANTAGTVTCTIGSTLAGLDAVPVTITVTAPTSGATTITNTATVHAANEPTLLAGNNSATASVTVPPPAALGLAKTSSASVVSGGSTITYTIVASNAGSGSSDNVSVVDTLPGSVAFVSASGGCANSAGVVTCSAGTLAASASATFAITVTAPSPATDTLLTNTASVSGTNEPTANQGNNTASNVTTVLGEPDVTLTKAAAPDPVITGNNLTYTLTPHNIGTGTAAGVTIIDPLPAGTTFVSASAGCTNSAGTVICTIGTIAPASDGPAKTIVVQTPSVLTTTVVTNTATVSAANELLPAQGNNAATAATTIPAPPDVTLSKAASIDPVTAGEAVTYTLTAHNIGPGDAEGVTITDSLPAGTTFVSATVGCTETSGTVTCAVGSIPAGLDAAPVTITLEAPTAAATATLANTAAVQAVNEPAANAGNNSTASTIGVLLPDLTVSIDALPSPVHADGALAYTITVHNGGSGSAHDVQLLDQLDPSSVFVAAPGCGFSAGQVTCALGTIAAGADSVVTVNTLAPHALVGTTITTEALTTATNEPTGNQANNSATLGTWVDADPDVVVTVQPLPNAVASSGVVVYVAHVRNLGSLPADGVQLVENLPPEVTLQPLPAGCSNIANVVTCAAGTLSIDDYSPGGPDEAVIYISVNAPVVPADTTLGMTASVSATNEPAANTANNGASASLLVGYDTDGDGYPDVAELEMGTSPYVYCGTMRADVNNDGRVSLADLIIAAANYGQSVPPAPARYDQNGDGRIQLADLIIIAGVYGQQVSICP